MAIFHVVGGGGGWGSDNCSILRGSVNQHFANLKSWLKVATFHVRGRGGGEGVMRIRVNQQALALTFGTRSEKGALQLSSVKTN